MISGRRIYAGYDRRYDRKVAYIISLATDADTSEESVIWTAYPFTEVPQVPPPSKNHLANGRRIPRTGSTKFEGQAV